MTNAKETPIALNKGSRQTESVSKGELENSRKESSEDEPTGWQTSGVSHSGIERASQDTNSFQDYLNAYSLLDHDDVDLEIGLSALDVRQHSDGESRLNEDVRGNIPQYPTSVKKIYKPSLDKVGIASSAIKHERQVFDAGVVEKQKKEMFSTNIFESSNLNSEAFRAETHEVASAEKKMIGNDDNEDEEVEKVGEENGNKFRVAGVSQSIHEAGEDDLDYNDGHNEIDAVIPEEDGGNNDEDDEECNDENADGGDAEVGEDDDEEVDMEDEDEDGEDDGDDDDDDDGDDDGDDEISMFGSMHNSLLLRELVLRSASGGGESTLLNAMQRLVGGFENSTYGSQISEFDSLIQNLEQLGDPYIMLETVSEILERLLMMDGLTAERVVPSNKLASALINILNDPALENDLELHLVTCRCLFNFIEVNLDFIHDALNNGVVQVLASKLLNIVYIDLTEQCLQTLEVISQEKESHSLIIAGNGIRSCLQNLDFLTIHAQRKCLKIVANSCLDIKQSQFDVVAGPFTNLYLVAKDHCDGDVKDIAWLAISRIAECFRLNPDCLESLFLDKDILSQLLEVIKESCHLESDGFSLEDQTRQCLLKSLVLLISRSVKISNVLLDLNIGEFVKICLYNFKKTGEINISNDPTRSPNLPNLEALISCPKEILSHLLEVIAYILPTAYPVEESPFLAREESQVRKELNGMRANFLSDQKLPKFLSFVGQIWSVLVLAFQATMDYGVRKRVVVCFTRIVFFCQSNDLHDIENFRSLFTIFSSVLSGGLKALRVPDWSTLDSIQGGPSRSQALLTYGTCIIIKELLKKSEYEYGIALSKEGAFDDLKKMKDILISFAKELEESLVSESCGNISPRYWEYADVGSSPSENDYVDGEITDFMHHIKRKPILLNLFRLLTEIDNLHGNFTEHNISGYSKKISDVSEQLKILSPDISSHASDWAPLWDRLIILLQERDEKVSSYELLSLGIIKELSGILSCGISAKSIPVRTFVSAFYNCPDSLVQLVTLLHDSLSRSELFEVISSGKHIHNGVSNLTTSLSRQIKINLLFGSEFEKKDMPRNILLSVQSIATLESVDAYVKSKFFADSFSKEEGFSFKGGADASAHLLGFLDSKFVISGHIFSKDVSLFGAVYNSLKSALSFNRVEAQNLWQKTHTIEYKVHETIFAESNDHLLQKPKEYEFADSHSLCTLDLLKSLYFLNLKVSKAMEFSSISSECFMNWKLTVKLNKQLDEPLIIASGCMPQWTFHIVREYPFLFPIEPRMQFMQSTSFGLSRLIHNWQLRASKGHNSMSDSTIQAYGQLGMPSRKKARVSRDKLLHSAIRVLMDYGTVPGILEIEYFDEVGSGLGPTLEFYANVSQEFSKSELHMWMQSATSEKYVFATNGLYPSAISEQDTTVDRKKLLFMFHILGKFVARALIDSRILDLHFSPVFVSMLQNPEVFESIIASEDIDLMLELLNEVDDELCASLTHLTRYFPHLKGESNDELIQVDGMTVSDLCLTFVLPGNANIPLVPNGSEILVMARNLESYIKRVLIVTLVEGIQDQVQAFREGFSLVFSIDSISCFTATELAHLLGSAEEDWSKETITRAIRANHGYSKDSEAFKSLVEIMLNFGHEERRNFLQFITGSPRLPVGGFQSMKPDFTVVEKHPDVGQSSDDYLPSVMTCANFLKLPNYSLREIMRAKVCHAMKEGASSFHLS